MAKKPRKPPHKNAAKPTKGPGTKPLPVPALVEHAIAVGMKEINQGASDQQITQSLRDSGIELKKLPPDFLPRLRAGASFKPKPVRPVFQKKSN